MPTPVSATGAGPARDASKISSVAVRLPACDGRKPIENVFESQRDKLRNL